MTIQIPTDAAFYKRLAELAWETASDTQKTAVIDDITRHFKTDPKLHAAIITRIGNEVVEQAVKDFINESADIAEILHAAVTAISKRFMSKDFIESVADKHVEAAESQLNNILVTEIRKAIAPRLLRTQVADAIKLGTAKAVSDYVKQADVEEQLNHTFDDLCSTLQLEASKDNANRQHIQVDKIADHVSHVIQNHAVKGK